MLDYITGEGGGLPLSRRGAARASRNFDSQKFESRVSNPRTIAYVHLNVPFESSNLPGAVPIILQDAWTFESWPCRPRPTLTGDRRSSAVAATAAPPQPAHRVGCCNPLGGLTIISTKPTSQHFT